MKAIIIGSKSDIAQSIKPMLEKDGYEVSTWARGEFLPREQWDLFIITLGVVAPVGLWHDVSTVDWNECLYSNLQLPFDILRSRWEYHNPNSTVIWFAGSNPQKIMDGYSSYNCSKMAVLKLVEQLDHETPDCKFVAFGPGYAKTKIHKATLEANWPNERIARGDDGNSMEDIYNAMMWCVRQNKNSVGGKNICVSDVPTDLGIPMDFVIRDELFKLRRVERVLPYRLTRHG